MIYLHLFAYLCIFYALFRLHKKLDAMKAQDEVTRQWIFDSLYSINHEVKLPEAIDKFEPKEAIVISDKTDPYKEFTGDHDDWFS